MARGRGTISPELLDQLLETLGADTAGTGVCGVRSCPTCSYLTLTGYCQDLDMPAADTLHGTSTTTD